MQVRSLADPDGHIWGIMYLDVERYLEVSGKGAGWKVVLGGFYTSLKYVLYSVKTASERQVWTFVVRTNS
jgi:hypothetical protein